MTSVKMSFSKIKLLFKLVLLTSCLQAFADQDDRIAPTDNVGGFLSGTVVHTGSGPDTIQNIKINDRLLGFSLENGQVVESRVTHVHVFQVNQLVRLSIGDEEFYLNPDHRFYLPDSNLWVTARDLAIDSHLLSRNGRRVPVTSKKIIDGREWIYDLTVEDTENYFVGSNQILVHNFAFVIPIVTWVISEGIVWATAATIGVALGTWAVANEISKRSDNRQSGTIDFGSAESRRDLQTGRLESESGSSSSTSAQEPGIPTVGDGFVPAKNWDGKTKVRSPNGRGFGYPDKKGNVWVPTGPRPGMAHGGPHWDVQHPDGSYDNIYPGGRQR